MPRGLLYKPGSPLWSGASFWWPYTQYNRCNTNSRLRSLPEGIQTSTRDFIAFCLDVPWCRAFNQTTCILRKHHLCLVFLLEISFCLEVWVLGCSLKGQKRIENGMGK